MPGVKNIRQGRIRIQSGDPIPLEKITEFTQGDFTFTENFPTNIIRDRGRIREINAGDEQPVDWSFSATFIREFLHRTLRDKIFDGLAETIGGLIPAAVNTNVLLTYAYEQNSFQLAATEPGVKLAVPGTPPGAVDEFSEEPSLGFDIEGVLIVQKGGAGPGSGGFNVQQAAGDVDRDVVYDAVGQTTLVLPGFPADCSGGRKTFKLILDIFDACNPPDFADPTVGIIEVSYVVDNAFLTSDTFAEADDADTISFTGQALPLNGKVRIVPGGEP
ncbi:hypothetical protein LCGC14_0273420 [marine sediment metagenome]|uniref:Uncharacterized protein n=1 Tax=marine sediment metagenome TaxID=412755 RepID=A0A0F9TY29_9ZZZZ